MKHFALNKVPREGTPLHRQFGRLPHLRKETPREAGFSLMSAQSENDRKTDLAVKISFQVLTSVALSVPFQEDVLT